MFAFISVYADIGEVYARLENWLNQFIDKIDIDLMPGTQDFSNSYYP